MLKAATTARAAAVAVSESPASTTTTSDSSSCGNAFSNSAKRKRNGSSSSIMRPVSVLIDRNVAAVPTLSAVKTSASARTVLALSIQVSTQPTMVSVAAWASLDLCAIRRLKLILGLGSLGNYALGAGAASWACGEATRTVIRRPAGSGHCFEPRFWRCGKSLPRQGRETCVSVS